MELVELAQLRDRLMQRPFLCSAVFVFAASETAELIALDPETDAWRKALPAEVWEQLSALARKPEPPIPDRPLSDGTSSAFHMIVPHGRLRVFLQKRVPSSPEAPVTPFDDYVFETVRGLLRELLGPGRQDASDMAPPMANLFDQVDFYERYGRGLYPTKWRAFCNEQLLAHAETEEALQETLEGKHTDASVLVVPPEGQQESAHMGALGAIDMRKKEGRCAAKRKTHRSFLRTIADWWSSAGTA